MRAVLSVVAVVLLPGMAVAAMSESEQRSACMGDAFRLCATVIPDRGRIERCLSAKRDQLSPACRTAFDGGSGPRRASR